MLNQCNFIGRLGRDPECRSMQSGEKVANISIGVSESWKDKDGNKQERTEWVRGSAFGKLADIMGQYLKKGSLVYISGKMQTRKYEKNGQDVYATEINIREMKMLGGKSENNDTQPSAHNQAKQDGYQPPASHNAAYSSQAPASTPVLDDDIPF